MIKALLSPYIQIISDFAFKKVSVWLLVVAFGAGYAVFSSIMWAKQVRQNAALEIELMQNKSKIDSIKIYQNIWLHENEDLRKRIASMDEKVRLLDKKYQDDLKNDKTNSIDAQSVSDDDAISQLAKRYGFSPKRGYSTNQIRTGANVSNKRH